MMNNMEISRKKTGKWKKQFDKYCMQPYSEIFPRRVTIEPTNSCNLKCRMCPRHNMEYSIGFMDFSLFKKIADEIAKTDKSTKIVLFFRGESLLHDRFPDMVSYLAKKGLDDVSIATNAMLLDSHMTDLILDAGLKFISFSIDASSRENYHTQRIGADYELVLDNIDAFLKGKKQRDLKNPQIQVSLVETKINSNDIKDFIAYWTEKVDRVRIYKEHSRAGGFGSLMDNGGKLGFSQRLPCPKVICDMVVYWDGKAAICNHDWDRKDEIGDINKSTIKEIYNGDIYREIRLKHYRGNICGLYPCESCDYWMTFYLDTGMFGKVYQRKHPPP